MTETVTDYDAGTLPAVVVSYLDARDADRYDDAAALFTPDAVVVDNGHTYEGRDAVSAWIRDSSSEFEYTATRIGQDIRDESFTGGRSR